MTDYSRYKIKSKECRRRNRMVVDVVSLYFLSRVEGSFIPITRAKRQIVACLYCLNAVTVNCNADSIFFFFSLFAGCIQWLPDITMLTQGPQRMCNCNDTKRHVSHQVT